MGNRAIIVDIDGTLSQSNHVDQYTDVGGSVDWKAWMNSNQYAPVNEWCREIVNAAIAMGTQIIFLTARTGDAQGWEVTDMWLKNNGFTNYKLFMRKEGDYRPDYAIKQEIYNTEIMAYYDVQFAIDDKKRIIDMWRSLDIPALHCADY